ncbi:hypothetical protein D3C72_2238640 [compost metagenome]
MPETVGDGSDNTGDIPQRTGTIRPALARVDRFATVPGQRPRTRTPSQILRAPLAAPGACC